MPTATATNMHSFNGMAERLTEEVARRARLEPAQVDPNAHFVLDLGMSSLDLLSVLAFVEKSFSTRFPDETLAELNTLNKVMHAVQDHLTKQAVGER